MSNEERKQTSGPRVKNLRKRRIANQKMLQQSANWAVVAYALRAVLRLRPLLESAWPSIPKEHVAAVDQALASAAAVAENPVARTDRLKARVTASQAVTALGRVTTDAFDARYNKSDATELADSLMSAVSSLMSAAADDDPYDNAVHALGSAAYAADKHAESISEAFELAAIADLERIRKIAKDRNISNHQNGNRLRYFGPLWPVDKPEGWPITGDMPGAEGAGSEQEDSGQDESGAVPSGLDLRIFLPEGLSEDDAFDHLKNLIAALDARHKELGGAGLQIDDIEAWVPATVPVTQPGGAS